MKAIVIAGTHSGVGKTSIAVGVMVALRRRGLSVQPFKVGPDFIDPGHHRRATGRVSRNLDGWMLSRQYNVETFRCHTANADIAVVEGVMGLFDGYDGKSESGSTAEMAKWIGAPVLLVVDAWALSRSAAAMLQGYESFDPSLNVAGVVFNKIGGTAHLEWLRQAVEPVCRSLVIGGIPKDPAVTIPERHLGLWMADEDRLSGKYVSRLADLVETHLNLEKVLALAEIDTGSVAAARRRPAASGVRIGVARDEAFCFYYRDNLDLLEDFGAEIVEFSPLRHGLPPNLGGIYLGGGYPELYGEALSNNRRLLAQIRDFAARGGVVYGECGGLMYLSRGIISANSRRFELCGLFPFWTKMVPTLKLNYAEVRTLAASRLFPPQQIIRGHIFHFSEMIQEGSAERCYQVRTYGCSDLPEGFQIGNQLASYVHLHFGSNPEFARHFVWRCKECA